jgi:flagellar biosynthesis anti-sigma factor FlgM
MAKAHDMVDSTALGPARPIGRLNSEARFKPASAPVKSETTTQATSLPKLIQLANQLAEQDIPIDYAKIAMVRQAVALGTFQTDPAAIAEAMLKFGRTL